MGDGVFEWRIDRGPGYRVHFGRDGKTVVILLTAGEKRSQDADIMRQGCGSLSLQTGARRAEAEGYTRTKRRRKAFVLSGPVDARPEELSPIDEESGLPGGGSWWVVLGSNQWPLLCESSALPLS